jgi:transposase-like protein
MTTVKTRFTPELRLRALDALAKSAGDYDGIGQAFGVTRRTLLSWQRQRQQIVQQVAHDLHVEQMHEATILRLELLIEEVLESLPEKIASAKLSESVRAIFMLQELRQGVSSRQERGTALRDKLTDLVERYTAEARASGQLPPESDEDDDPDDFDED